MKTVWGAEEELGRLRRLTRGAVRSLAVLAAAAGALALGADTAWAQDELEGVADIEAILNRIKTWIQTIAITFAIVMACIAGIRYLVSSDTTGTEKAKAGLRSAAIGLAIVLLAETLVGIAAYFIEG